MKLPCSAFLFWFLPMTVLWSQTREANTAISSEAVMVQPKVPARLPTPKTAESAKNTTPPSDSGERIDPLLDPDRPKNCQLETSSEQTLSCGKITVVLPAGTYKQITIVEDPGARKAIQGTDLKAQAAGLGYIRYQTEAKLNVGGRERIGGIDVGIRPRDNLPIRIWYKKMSEVDDITKAFTFIFPPVGLIAGAGAWSSGNFLIPEKPPVFTEARDYYLRIKPGSPETGQVAQPAVRLTTPAPTNRTRSGLRSP
ncbi:MAG: hypothetical protein EBZ78_11455 [Verrucomicrobia bacterium]|nr:hypothetical protein [Verrucomicrobiota bacterium]